MTVLQDTRFGPTAQRWTDTVGFNLATNCYDIANYAMSPVKEVSRCFGGSGSRGPGQIEGLYFLVAGLVVLKVLSEPLDDYMYRQDRPGQSR